MREKCSVAVDSPVSQTIGTPLTPRSSCASRRLIDTRWTIVFCILPIQLTFVCSSAENKAQAIITFKCSLSARNWQPLRLAGTTRDVALGTSRQVRFCSLMSAHQRQCLRGHCRRR